MEHDDENPFGEASLEAVRKARAALGQPSPVPASVSGAVPLLGKVGPFLSDAASIVPAGSPAPRLVRSALALGKAVSAALSDPFRRPATAAPDTVAGMGAEASRAAAKDLVRLAGLASDNARSDRRSLSGLGKFVENAIVLRAGAATDAAPLLTLTRRLAAAGIVGGFSLVIAPDDAAAWGQGRSFNGMAVARPVPNQNYNRPAFNPGAVQAWREQRAERREERRTAMVATGAVIAGAIIGSRLSNNGNYGGNYAQPYPQAYPQAYAQPYPQAYGAYGGGYPPRQAYGSRPGVPSDGFVLDAKKLIALQVGSVHRADAILDQAIAQGVACLRQMGPGANCTTRTHGIMLDFSQGEFIATANGQPVMMERGGIIQRFNHGILAEADAESRNIMAQENGMGRRGYNGY